MAVEKTVGFLFIAPAIWGLVVSLVEIFFVMQDEGGMHPLSHGLHAVPTCVIFSYIAMNAGVVGMYLSQYIGFFGNTVFASIVVPIIIGLIATIKVKAAAAIIGGHGSVGEKLGHAFVVGMLIAAGPFLWPLVQQYVPVYLQR